MSLVEVLKWIEMINVLFKSISRDQDDIRSEYKKKNNGSTKKSQLPFCPLNHCKSSNYNVWKGKINQSSGVFATESKSSG